MSPLSTPRGVASTPATSQRTDARRNRRAILEAADRLLHRDGWDANMHEVAASAGVGIGTVYRHFPSKQILLGALIARRFDLAAAHVADAVDGPGPALARLGRALRTGASVVAADPLTRLGTNGAGPTAWEYAEVSRLAFDESFRPLVAEAHSDGSLRPDFGVDDVGSVMRAVCAVADEAHPERWQRLLEIVVDGLRA